MSADLPTVTLGRTGLEVSVAGLGCGGLSRLGQSTGATEGDSVRVIHRALDLGVTFFDTASLYGTEEIVGTALRGRREKAVVSTKSPVLTSDGELRSGSDLRRSVEASLRRLQMDHVEVFHLHGVQLAEYDHCCNELVPVLMAMQTEGTLGHLAISERFHEDTSHEMLSRAVADDIWDVIMVGFSPLNPSARARVLPEAMAKDIGVLVMYAVRRALSDRDALRRQVAQLVESGQIRAADVDLEDPLGFLVEDGAAGSTIEAAYRFARHEAGTHVVLTGTGNVTHLEQNVDALSRGPLPDRALQRLDDIFGTLDSIHGD